MSPASLWPVSSKWSGAGVLLLLVGCASRPPAVPPPPTVEPTASTAPSDGPDPQLLRFMSAQSARATLAEAQGRLHEASQAWEVLALIAPDESQPQRELARVQRLIETAVSRHLSEAIVARKRGDADSAFRHYLDVLALAPTHVDAADALRSIERETVRRQLAGRPARFAPAIRPTTAMDPRQREVMAATRGSRNLLEHATLLRRQGDLVAAIQLLRESAATPGDAALRSLLVELYVQRAESLRQSDPAAARQSIDAALALDRHHPAAQALAQQLPQRGPAAKSGP